MEGGFYFTSKSPGGALATFVERIGVFGNPGAAPRDVVVLPDGRIDLFFWRNDNGGFDVLLLGLETEAEQRSVPPDTLAYTISFTPLGVEYLLGMPIAGFLNSGIQLDDGFWGFTAADFADLDTFYTKAMETLRQRLPAETDGRKEKLFSLMYAANGEISVAALAVQVGWGSRQINRYFSQYFGLPLKVYCTILRFRASLPALAHGKLFPELDFADQNHFIKEIKKFAGVVPKELSKNENDRFVLLSLLKGQ
ncbi:transcriptional regulator [Flavobacterium akiainvivens]|uniref:Transcriptional regulator n=1 Tax=Flavobacterium akiainvivens TaxID=1202724 RepID=A0A0N0RR12_9FLAO|nr:AraC family transcriptional regulator [Flavobacterium akiainvivens]KOS07472.1 transcriptional regulator [Flavobacterium akiainvivens]SFQ63303.1 AraC-type DNA-binding protein [Flavobacterium akiainvivens]